MSEHEQVYELNGKDWNFLSYWTTADSNDETRYSGSSDIASLDEFLEPFKIKGQKVLVILANSVWIPIPFPRKIIRTILE